MRLKIDRYDFDFSNSKLYFDWSCAISWPLKLNISKCKLKCTQKRETKKNTADKTKVKTGETEGKKEDSSLTTTTYMPHQSTLQA